MTTGGGGQGVTSDNLQRSGRSRPILHRVTLSPIRDLEEIIIPPLPAPKGSFQCPESPPELVQSLPFSLIVFVGDDLLLPKSLD